MNINQHFTIITLFFFPKLDKECFGKPVCSRGARDSKNPLLKSEIIWHNQRCRSTASRGNRNLLNPCSGGGEVAKHLNQLTGNSVYGVLMSQRPLKLKLIYSILQNNFPKVFQVRDLVILVVCSEHVVEFSMHLSGCWY